MNQRNENGASGDTIAVIMEGKQIKSMPKVKAIEITVPIFRTGTDLMSIRERMGMDAGAVT